MNKGITRRDFLSGMALSLAAGSTLSPREILARVSSSSSYYPPGLTGLRGSHPGSFEVAHSMAMQGVQFSQPSDQTDDIYDLVVVGGGLSGLASAWCFRKQAGDNARILILDNHDDFGGHAKRNEFNVDGHHLIGYGGSQSIESPSAYSSQAMQILKDLDIDLEKFYQYFDRDFYSSRQMSTSIYFDQEHYGADKLVKAPAGFTGIFSMMYGTPSDEADTIDELPISENSRTALRQLIETDEDYLQGKSDEEKYEILESISYSQYLRQHAAMPEEVITLLEKSIAPLDALNWDAIAASDAAGYLFPGTVGLGLEGSTVMTLWAKAKNIMPDKLWMSLTDKLGALAGEDPYIFHFPDGNAGIARLMVRAMIPSAAAGNSMDDIVKTPVDYSKLDQSANQVRIRLNSTAVDVRHTANKEEVDISYMRKGQAYRVRSKHTILACNNKFIPHICTEIPAEQSKALDLAVRAPLVYINVALTNWRAFAKANAERIYAPQGIFSHTSLDFPVSMGDYNFSSDPDKPIIAHIVHTPSANLARKNMDARALFKTGQQAIYNMSFDDYEQEVYALLDGALSNHGFDSKIDIAAITVNRWPHGYAYWPMDLWDDYDYHDNHAPHVIGRAQLHRISIANSDAESQAYVNGAFDAAYRAANEQLGL
jgi:spermidine dehydrogenase